MSLVAVIGQFDVHPEDTVAVAALMRTMTSETVREEGCLHYAFSSDLLDPNRFQLSELWADDESLAAHSNTAHMANFRKGMAALRIEKRTVKRYSATERGTL